MILDCHRPKKKKKVFSWGYGLSGWNAAKKKLGIKWMDMLSEIQINEDAKWKSLSLSCRVWYATPVLWIVEYMIEFNCGLLKHLIVCKNIESI